MKIFLFRHGAVQDSGEKIFLGRTDLPLSAEGRRQAEAWKAYWARRLPDRIVSSPLIRSAEFARILAQGRAAEICPELSEIDLGDWDGRSMAEIREIDPASWKARGEDMAGFRPPGGESFGDVYRRVVPAFERLTARTGPDLVVVGHAGVNRLILCHLLDMPLENLFRIGQDFACMNVIERRREGFRVMEVNRSL